MWTDAVSRSPHRTAAVNAEFSARRFQNTIEDIYNLMSLKNVNTWKDLIYQTQVGQMGRSHLDLWDLYFGGSYDDAGVGFSLTFMLVENVTKGGNSGRCSYTFVSEIS